MNLEDAYTGFSRRGPQFAVDGRGRLIINLMAPEAGGIIALGGDGGCAAGTAVGATTAAAGYDSCSLTCPDTGDFVNSGGGTRARTSYVVKNFTFHILLRLFYGFADTTDAPQDLTNVCAT